MTPTDIANQIAIIAGHVADCADLDPRDRNAIVGQLRASAGQVRGLAGLPGYRQAPFAPTTPCGGSPEPK